MYKAPFIVFLVLLSVNLWAKNPIIPNKGVNDPHIRIIDGKAYLSASHDMSVENSTFLMKDWCLWSSDDLVNWKIEYTLKPEDTYIGKPFEGCWATDITTRNGKYYWYFSERNHQSGVMVANSMQGPWIDPLGKPLLTEELTPTHEYDMGIIEDSKGNFYIVFGVWDYYIAKLNDDMISLAEKSRKIIINNPHGPYNQDGNSSEQTTDDKPFIHFHNGNFYLSWGCFYAMADNPYGPYDYKGSIIEKESFAPGYDAPTWPKGFKQGRHGSFFNWHNQWYFAYCDISQTGNRFFRDTFISYIHYKKNGEIALIRVDSIGVGEYNANQTIEAEDYFEAKGISKIQKGENNFVIGQISNNDYLIYNKIHGTNKKSQIEINALVIKNSIIELRKDSQNGELISTYICSKNSNTNKVVLELPELNDTENICFVFKGKGQNIIEIDSFKFK